MIVTHVTRRLPTVASLYLVSRPRFQEIVSMTRSTLTSPAWRRLVAPLCCAVVGTAIAPTINLAAQEATFPTVILETNLGNIEIKLMPDRAPKSVAHFLTLVEQGFYDEILFHRVVRNFVVQAGLINMNGEIVGEEVAPVENEADNRLRNRRGSVALARLDDPHSATAEFFINVRDNRDLDFVSYKRDEWGFAVFGEVINGMNIVDEIARVDTRRAGILRDFPREPVVIYRAYRAS